MYKRAILEHNTVWSFHSQVVILAKSFYFNTTNWSTSLFNEGSASLSSTDPSDWQFNALEISTLVETSGLWYLCKYLISRWPVRSIINLSQIPFSSPRVAVVARLRLWLLNWPCRSASLHILLTTFPSLLCPTGVDVNQTAKINSENKNMKQNWNF